MQHTQRVSAHYYAVYLSYGRKQEQCVSLSHPILHLVIGQRMQFDDVYSIFGLHSENYKVVSFIQYSLSLI